jgi:hypothetical protein
MRAAVTRKTESRAAVGTQGWATCGAQVGVHLWLIGAHGRITFVSGGSSAVWTYGRATVGIQGRVAVGAEGIAAITQ